MGGGDGDPILSRPSLLVFPQGRFFCCSSPPFLIVLPRVSLKTSQRKEGRGNLGRETESGGVGVGRGGGLSR